MCSATSTIYLLCLIVWPIRLYQTNEQVQHLTQAGVCSEIMSQNDRHFNWGIVLPSV
jgi:hypothetical protein